MAPLPPLPANNTSRYFITLQTAVDTYTQQIRCASDFSVADLDIEYLALLTEMSALVPQTFVVGVDYQEIGTDVSYPVSSTLVGTEIGSGTALKANAPKFISWIGRTILGRRVSLTLFGTALAFPESYRFPVGANADVDAVRTVIVAAEGWLQAKDGLKAGWKGYANCGYNGYKERRNRL